MKKIHFLLFLLLFLFCFVAPLEKERESQWREALTGTVQLIRLSSNQLRLGLVQICQSCQRPVLKSVRHYRLRTQRGRLKVPMGIPTHTRVWSVSMLGLTLDNTWSLLFLCCCRITEFSGFLFFWLLKLVHCTSGTIHQHVGRGKGSPQQGPVRGARVLEISKQSPHNPPRQQGRGWMCESRGKAFRRLALLVPVSEMSVEANKMNFLKWGVFLYPAYLSMRERIKYPKMQKKIVQQKEMGFRIGTLCQMTSDLQSST